MNKFADNSLTLNNKTKLTVEKKSLIARPDTPDTRLCFSYPTMIKLAHNGDRNGEFVMAHASLFGSASDNGYRVYRSGDFGDSWEYISRAVDDFTPGVEDNVLQPCLFELPRDMGSFKEGTLFMGGCSRGRYPDGSGMSAVTLYYSEDIGVTWKAYHVLAMGGTAPDTAGVWEPFFIYEEETGRVYCFYSDETGEKAGPTAQKLVYKYTTDMENWSDIRISVDAPEPALRPGMIAISKMGNGEYIMVYEVVGIKGNPIYYKKTKNLDDWGDLTDYGNVVITDDQKTFGSSPWCAWTPAGGECGMLVVAANHMVQGGPSIYGTGTDLFVSFDYGKTYTAIENPIPFTPVANHKCSYSPYIGFSDDGHTMYYINNPEYGENCQQMIFARIRIS